VSRGATAKSPGCVLRRIVLGVAISAGVFWCAQTNARAPDYDSKADNTAAKMLEVQKGVVTKLRAPLEKFLNEPTPRSCVSQNLVDATMFPPAFLAGMQDRGIPNDIAFLHEIGVVILDTADAALAAGCYVVARQAYGSLIRMFIGSAYEPLRQRAQIGLDALRAKH
jgi:hypothetical protein